MTTEPRTIYVLTMGDYSEYRIVGAVTDKAVAEAFEREGPRYESCHFQCVELDNLNIEGVEGKKWWTITMDMHSGNVVYTWRDDSWCDDDDKVGFAMDNGNLFRVSVLAAHLDGAIKAANDKRAQFKAANL